MCVETILWGSFGPYSFIFHPFQTTLFDNSGMKCIYKPIRAEELSGFEFTDNPELQLFNIPVPMNRITHQIFQQSKWDSRPNFVLLDQEISWLDIVV